MAGVLDHGASLMRARLNAAVKPGIRDGASDRVRDAAIRIGSSSQTARFPLDVLEIGTTSQSEWRNIFLHEKYWFRYIP